MPYFSPNQITVACAAETKQFCCHDNQLDRVSISGALNRSILKRAVVSIATFEMLIGVNNT